MFDRCLEVSSLLSVAYYFFDFVNGYANSMYPHLSLKEEDEDVVATEGVREIKN
jgi:hypothetical protein